jgi:hypothetical protein
MKTSRLTSLFVLSAILLGGCAKKNDPQTTLNRNSDGSSGSAGASGFNQGDEFSELGAPLRGNLTDSDLLQPRDAALEGFSDPLNTIRPFDAVLFGFDQYNLSDQSFRKLLNSCKAM